MIRTYIENANLEDTGFSYTLSLISGKHKSDPLLPDGVSGGAVQRIEAVPENHFRQDPQHQPEGAGSGQADRSDRVSPDPAEGGVQPFRKRKVIDGCTGSTLHLGRREQIGKMISSYFM